VRYERVNVRVVSAELLPGFGIFDWGVSSKLENGSLAVRRIMTREETKLAFKRQYDEIAIFLVAEGERAAARVRAQ
jgi:hypothetical protein